MYSVQPPVPKLRPKHLLFADYMVVPLVISTNGCWKLLRPRQWASLSGLLDLGMVQFSGPPQINRKSTPSLLFFFVGGSRISEPSRPLGFRVHFLFFSDLGCKPRRRGPESRNRSRSANSLINCQPQRLLRQPPAPLQSNVAADVGDGQLRIRTSPTPETSIYGTPKMAEHGQILHSYHSWSLFFQISSQPIAEYWYFNKIFLPSPGCDLTEPQEHLIRLVGCYKTTSNNWISCLVDY